MLKKIKNWFERSKLKNRFVDKFQYGMDYTHIEDKINQLQTHVDKLAMIGSGRFHQLEKQQENLFKQYDSFKKDLGSLKCRITTGKTAFDKFIDLTEKKLHDLEYNWLHAQLNRIIHLEKQNEKLRIEISRVSSKQNEIDKREKRLLELMQDGDKNMNIIFEEQKRMLGRFENALAIQGKSTVSQLMDIVKKFELRVKDDARRNSDTATTQK